jgi:transposase-like protein
MDRYVCLVHLRRHLSSLPRPLNQLLEILERDGLPQDPGPRETDFPDGRTSLSRPNHKLQPAAIDALVQAYQSGATIEALAREFRIYRQTVRAHLERRGVAMRPQTVLAPTQIPELIARYEAGRSLRQLAVEFGVSNGSVRNYLLKAGVTLRPAVRPKRQAASSD